MVGTKGSKPQGGANPHQSRSQFGLQAATRLHEAGIASNREISILAVNTFSGLVHTARQTMKVANTRSQWPSRKEGGLR